MLAGAARADITPEMGTQLAGDIGRRRPVEEIRDRLYANALVLESAGRRICLLSLDLLCITNHWSDVIRRQASEKFGLDLEAVMVHVVQNHASPALGHTFVSDECTLMPRGWLRGGDDAYNEPTVQKCLRAIEAAVENLEPAKIRVGRGIDGRVAFNRRFVMRDGTVETHPAACDPNILHCEGPIDPEVGIMTLANESGGTIAALLHHTCHPCHGYPHRYVIGDWPGAWGEMMREQLGEQCVPLVINGCCGNIHHANHIDRDSAHDYHRMARLLAETASDALGRTEALSGTLAVERTVLRLPLRKLKAQEIDAARRIVEEHPRPKWLDAEKTRVDWDWIYAAALLDLKATQENDPNCDYEIQAFRIGDAALVTLMGEPFVEAQLRIKLASPARYTSVAHMCNGYAGYVPTEAALERGGYETRTGNWSKFQPEALDEITQADIDLLHRLFN